MNLKHYPNLPTEKIVQFYTKKDRVPISYVCTTALFEFDAISADVFYRDTPHPEFGNRYFYLYRNSRGEIMIGNADRVESLTFSMVKDSTTDTWFYSSHRHDYIVTDDNQMIDGGRAYTRSSGKTTDFCIRDGEFIEKELVN